MLYPRQIEPVLLHRLSAFPIVGITGPRQAGKTTLQYETDIFNLGTFLPDELYGKLSNNDILCH